MDRSATQTIFLALSILAALSSCASVPERHGLDTVRNLVRDREEGEIVWKDGGTTDSLIEDGVHDLLSNPLTVDDAVQVALANSPSLQATLEDLGIGRADLVEAGLIDNPTISAKARFPDRPPRAANLEFSVAQDLVGLLTLSSRRRLANEQFVETELRVADAALNLATDVRSAYYVFQGALQLAEVRRTIAEASEASAELAQRQFEAGNLNELALAREKGFHEESGLDLLRAKSEARQARERLAILMGLERDTGWTLAGGLSDVPEDDFTTESLETLALSRRLDLAAAQQESNALGEAAALKRRWRWLPFLRVEIGTERDTSGQYVTGPTLEFAVPLFDRGQASLARLESQKRKADRLAEDLAVRIRSEVRQAIDRVHLQRDVADRMRRVVLPLQERIVGLSLEQYNYMLADPYQLLAAKRTEFEAYQTYLHAVREYWIARAALDRAIGGRLTDPRVPPLPPPSRDGTKRPPETHTHSHSTSSAPSVPKESRSK